MCRANMNLMKHVSSLISTLLLVTTPFLSNGFAQDYVHYKTLTGHTTIGGALSVSFSPDGLTLASGGADYTILLWDTTKGIPKKTLTGHSEAVFSVTFSSNQRILASASGDRTVRLWDVGTGAHLKTLVGHNGFVRSVAFSPDGRTLVSGSDDKTVRLWDAGTGAHLKTLVGHNGFVRSVAFSPDGRTLVSGSDDKTVRLWDAGTGAHLKTLIGHTGVVYSVSFSPDGRTVASGSWDKTVRLSNISTGTHLKTLAGHTDLIYSVSFSPVGRFLASGSGDKTIYLKNIVMDTQLKTLSGHTGIVWSVAFSPDGKTLASGGMDHTVRLWKLSSPLPQKLTANQVYEKAIRAVMWIVNPGIGEGSGVLIDKKSKLAITNAHVTGKQNTIDVYFPAPDEKGELIKDRNFYLTSGDVLKRLGYYTKGHVIAKNEKTDLAIIRLDGLPETARQIDWKLTPPTVNVGELVYVLGNPAKQDLWRWTLGEFLNDHQDFLHIQSDVFGGNSGGPVLNKQGILIGIVARSDQLMNAAAIPMRHIHQLLSDSKVKHSRLRR